MRIEYKPKDPNTYSMVNNTTAHTLRWGKARLPKSRDAITVTWTFYFVPPLHAARYRQNYKNCLSFNPFSYAYDKLSLERQVKSACAAYLRKSLHTGGEVVVYCMEMPKEHSLQCCRDIGKYIFSYIKARGADEEEDV